MHPEHYGPSSVKYLEFPSNLGSFNAGAIPHWISFQAFSFKAKGKKNLDIALYIPGDALTTSYKSEYESASLGALGTVAESAVQNFKGAEDIVKAGIEGLKKTMGAGGAGMQSEGAKVSMLKLGEKANVLREGAKTLMERAQGAVLNPYIVAAYKGPTDMRTHDFTFQMLPADVGESKTCVNIANSFKKAMLPSHAGGDSKTAPSMLFGYPDEFTITFYINGKRLPNTVLNPMFNVGRSVLTAVDLNFATESVPLFFDKTQYPVSIEMKLTFMEIEVMYKEKIDKGF